MKMQKKVGGGLFLVEIGDEVDYMPPCTHAHLYL